MSEMSSLSHEYASTSDFSRELNDAVLILKRRVFSGTQPVAASEAEIAARHVQSILSCLASRFEDAASSAPECGPTIPEDVIARLESDHRGDRTYFLADVKRLASSLAPAGPIDQADLTLLDSICTAADASASATFRKLWRR
jgi:hypothetical protein